MTYEERIAQTAKRKCDKLYISELIAAAFALTAFLPYLIFKNISFLVFFLLCIRRNGNIIYREKSKKAY